MNTLKVIVAGAAGNLGRLVCESLITRAKKAGQPVQVIGLVRAKATNTNSVPQGNNPTGSSVQELVFEPVDYNNEDDLKRVCQGAYSIISTLQGVDDVIVDVQSRLLKAAIANNVRRFIPSDYSLDFFNLPKGSNRNFDIRLRFHELANQLVKASRSNIEITSIFQGAFTELLSSGRILFDFKNRKVSYFGSPNTIMEFTTWKNTADYTAATALDNNPTPAKLCIAGARLSPKEAQQLATRVTGEDFKLKHMMSIKMLQRVIAIVKFINPDKNNSLPLWVGMQYGYSMAIGPSLPKVLDNDRYCGIEWTGIEDTVLQAYKKVTK